MTSRPPPDKAAAAAAAASVGSGAPGRSAASSGGDSQAGSMPPIHVSSAGAVGRTRPSTYSSTPTTAPPADSPKQIHSAVLKAALGRPVSVTAKCSRIGAIRNAAMARSSSRMAKTRWMEAERSEYPARNRAGTTEAPMPMPTSAEPARVSAEPGGTTARRTRIPAARITIPVRA